MVYKTDAIKYVITSFAETCIGKNEIPCFVRKPVEIDKFFYEIKKNFPEQFSLV
jgi:hypothetical protein